MLVNGSKSKLVFSLFGERRRREKERGGGGGSGLKLIGRNEGNSAGI